MATIGYALQGILEGRDIEKIKRDFDDGWFENNWWKKKGEP